MNGKIKVLKFTTQSLGITFQFNVFLRFLFAAETSVNLPIGRKLNLLHHNRPHQLSVTVARSIVSTVSVSDLMCRV